MLQSKNSLEAYVGALANRESTGLERGTAAAVLRKVTTPRLRGWLKLQGTRALALRSRRQARELADTGGELRLHLGSGTHRLDGWINVDILGMNADLLWDLRDGLPFPDSCVSAVFLEHVLEHFALADVLDVLRECHRVLAPGGIIRIGMPDFGRYLVSYGGDRHFIESERPGRPTALLAIAEVALAHGHRSVWDAETISLVLAQPGFAAVEVRAHGESALVPAPDAANRRGESVYAEATKRR